MVQNKTFLSLDVIKFQQNRRWSLLLHFQMIITRMWSQSVLPFKMYVFTLMENFEKSTMQKVCTDLAKTLPAVIYSAILRLQMPERNFVWNLQHIRVTTLVLSIRFTVEIKCRSGVIFSIITSLEPWSNHLSFLHRLSQSYSVSPLELFTKPSLIWNILDGVRLWVLSGWSENQKCGRSLFQMHLDLQLHVLLCSCYVRCRFPYMSIIFRKVNIKRSFNRFVLLLYWILSSVRSCILQALQIILRQCQQHTQSLLLLSLLSFLLSWSDIGIIGVEVIACCSLDCLLQCFLWFLKQFLYITKYLFLVYLSVSLFWSYCL